MACCGDRFPGASCISVQYLEKELAIPAAAVVSLQRSFADSFREEEKLLLYKQETWYNPLDYYRPILASIGVAVDDKSAVCIIVLCSLLLTDIAADSSKGARITIKSDIPMGAGLGSSASFGVALVAAMLVSPLSLSHPHHIRHCRDGKLSYEDLEGIHKWANVGETIFHGKSSGLDPVAITFSGTVAFKTGQAPVFLDE